MPATIYFWGFYFNNVFSFFRTLNTLNGSRCSSKCCHQIQNIPFFLLIILYFCFFASSVSRKIGVGLIICWVAMRRCAHCEEYIVYILTINSHFSRSCAVLFALQSSSTMATSIAKPIKSNANIDSITFLWFIRKRMTESILFWLKNFMKKKIWEKIDETRLFTQNTNYVSTRFGEKF